MASEMLYLPVSTNLEGPVATRQQASSKPNGRDRLLEAAAQLFNRLGYASTSVREIVAAAGVTKPVLYHYFGSKEGIYQEIVGHTLKHFEDSLRAFREREGSARERILHLCNEAFSLFLEHKDEVRLMYSVYYGPPQGAPHFDFDAFYHSYVNAFREAVDEGMRVGEFRRGNADAVAWALVGGVSVALESHLSETAGNIDRRGLNQILEVILSGITRKRDKLK
jgi:TetR/AcrR family transcriptional regulator